MLLWQGSPQHSAINSFRRKSEKNENAIGFILKTNT